MRDAGEKTHLYVLGEDVTVCLVESWGAGMCECSAVSATTANVISITRATTLEIL